MSALVRFAASGVICGSLRLPSRNWNSSMEMNCAGCPARVGITGLAELPPGHDKRNRPALFADPPRCQLLPRLRRKKSAAARRRAPPLPPPLSQADCMSLLVADAVEDTVVVIRDERKAPLAAAKKIADG